MELNSDKEIVIKDEIYEFAGRYYFTSKGLLNTMKNNNFIIVKDHLKNDEFIIDLIDKLAIKIDLKNESDIFDENSKYYTEFRLNNKDHFVRTSAIRKSLNLSTRFKKIVKNLLKSFT